MIVMVGNSVEWRLAGETEILGENLPQRHSVRHKSHLPDPGSSPGRRSGKPATNRLSYGTAFPFTSCIKLLHNDKIMFVNPALRFAFHTTYIPIKFCMQLVY
jgi:hypothetical protein